MANTFSQINIHAVFAVKFRDSLIQPSWEHSLHRYIASILQADTDYCLAVGGWKDHVHIFYEQKPAQCISDVLRAVKASSSRWINQQNFTKEKFAWQEGYGAFSHSKSQRNDVIQYVMTQHAHHQKETFQKEYLGILNNFEIDFDPKYLFEFFE